MSKNKLIKIIILVSIILITSNILKARVNNKIIISVGNEIITNYDLDREIKYLNSITLGKFKDLEKKNIEKIAIDSLIKDKIKVNELASRDVIVDDEIINRQVIQSARKIGFNNIDDFKQFVNMLQDWIPALEGQIEPNIDSSYAEKVVGQWETEIKNSLPQPSPKSPRRGQKRSSKKPKTSLDKENL